MKKQPKITELTCAGKRRTRDVVHCTDGIVGCCTATDYKGPKCVLELPQIEHIYRVRRLTPKEYGRLQGFPMEDWKQVVSNSQAYKQFGNAVTVSVAKAIGISILKFLENNSKEERSA